MRAFILFVLLTALGSSQSLAEVVEVPLPALQGRYYLEDIVERSASFQMERVPISISGASIRISGTLIIGEMYCENPSGIMLPEPYPINFVAYMSDSVTGDVWYAGEISPLVSGEFEIAMPFMELHGTWQFLLDGQGTVKFAGPPVMIIMLCSPASWPDAIVTSAALLVDGEFPVAAENTTWGGIKGLFR